MKENSRKINPLKDWKRELKDLEDSYFDLKEKELESIDTDEMCKRRCSLAKGEELLRAICDEIAQIFVVTITKGQ